MQTNKEILAYVFQSWPVEVEEMISRLARKSGGMRRSAWMNAVRQRFRAQE
jgi:hypothetical protein